MTPVDEVRVNTSDKSALERKRMVGNAVDAFFELGRNPIIQTTPPVVVVGGATKTENVDYVVDYNYGTITFAVPPVVNTEIIVLFYWAVFSDVEVQHFIDSSHSNVNLASGRLLLAMAADAARIAKRQLTSGGGGSGTNRLETQFAAQELRSTAKAFIDLYNQEDGADWPAEGLTEVPWTESRKEQAMEQRWIRES